MCLRLQELLNLPADLYAWSGATVWPPNILVVLDSLNSTSEMHYSHLSGGNIILHLLGVVMITLVKYIITLLGMGKCHQT